jgi:hypothetical protein
MTMTAPSESFSKKCKKGVKNERMDAEGGHFGNRFRWGLGGENDEGFGENRLWVELLGLGMGLGTVLRYGTVLRFGFRYCDLVSVLR